MWIVVFQSLPIKELLLIARTCSALRLLVKAYWPLAFNLARLLLPFLLPEHVPGFRSMLKTVGGIVSGSIALQFLDRTSYECSDLDIYIPFENASVADDWISKHGMAKEPPKANAGETPMGYGENRELTNITNYRVCRSGRLVQLISTKRSPVYAVLAFHSCMCLLTLI